MARELNISRSDLYARALQSYLRQHRRRAIRDQINAVESSLTDDERAEEQAITEGLQLMTADAMRRTAERGESW
jgi:metal-responsive CopG/Arc/MetJ family transcriptional regulator